MSQKLKVAFIVTFFLSLIASQVQAQTPRPTPTNVPQVQPGGDDTQGGSIQGAVYEDTNGDGRCGPTSLDSGGSVAGVDIEFVSSDAQTIVTLYTGQNGVYNLVAAGHSYWGVTAKPSSEWVVTSQKTVYVPIYPDSLVATDVNFCVQKAVNAKVVLPASGDPANYQLTGAIFIGLVFIGVGMFLTKGTSRMNAK